MTTASLARRLLAEFLVAALSAALVIGPGMATQHLSPHDIGR